jgi:hypothetical protein
MPQVKVGKVIKAVRLPEFSDRSRRGRITTAQRSPRFAFRCDPTNKRRPFRSAFCIAGIFSR